MNMIEAPSPNHDERRLPVEIAVIHYTGMTSAAAALARMRDPEAKVSAHYMIAEDGNLVRLVPEERRAWHAGLGFWRGVRDVNSASIGIELANPGHEHGYMPFPDPQIATLEVLLADLLKRHAIRSENVIGHSDLAPGRKIDPGELFPWDRLAASGLAETKPDGGIDPRWSDKGFLTALRRFGYATDMAEAAVAAFQRRWRPATVDGHIDADCRRILMALLKRHGPDAFILGTHIAPA
ncbi:MAG: N-acetylmuramoyl-L-alanine amidase [Pseudomonadota bacterium]